MNNNFFSILGPFIFDYFLIYGSGVDKVDSFKVFSLFGTTYVLVGLSVAWSISLVCDSNFLSLID